MELLIVSGLSGAGKSVAMNALEDIGFFCIDNVPAGLLPSITAFSKAGDNQGAGGAFHGCARLPQQGTD